MPILGGGCPDFTGENQNASTPLYFFLNETNNLYSTLIEICHAKFASSRYSILEDYTLLNY